MITDNPFIQALSFISPISDEAVKDLDAHIHYEEHSKNTELLKIGQVSHHIYFIRKGLARVYYFKDGNDVTDYFAIDNQMIGAVASLFTKQPSHKGIHLIEDSGVYKMNYDDFEKICAQHHDLERAARKMATFGMLEEQARIESILFHEAKERYLELGKQYPGLLNRCPLKYIASYLGITQVSLSRLRAEI